MRSGSPLFPYSVRGGGARVKVRVCSGIPRGCEKAPLRNG